MINEDISNYINHCLAMFLLILVIIFIHKNIFMNSANQINYIKDL